MKELTIGHVFDYLSEKKFAGDCPWLSSLIEAEVVKDRAALLELAKKGCEAKIAEINYNKCDYTCDYKGESYDFGSSYGTCELLGGRSCDGFHNMKGVCLCNKKCASKYIKESRQLLDKIIDYYNNNDPDFFEKTTPLLVYVKDDVKNLVIDDIDALKKYIHGYLVGRHEKSVQYDIACAKERYERTIKEGEEEIKKRKKEEEEFWKEI